jgi:hypothetical protein
VLLTLTQPSGVYVQPETGIVAAFDNIRVEQVSLAGDSVTVRLSNLTKFPADMTVLAESSRVASRRQASLPAKQLPVIQRDPSGLVEIKYHATGQVTRD